MSENPGGRLHHVRLMARYNDWMNRQLYAVCATIPDDARRRDLGAFFRSIHGTLNHLLLADLIWMGRFTGQPVAFDSLGQELYADFGELRREREGEDRRMLAWVDDLDEAALDRVVSYLSAVDGLPRRLRQEDALLHLFHHQTHHRGQLTVLIGQLGYDFGETDLPLMPGVAM